MKSQWLIVSAMLAFSLASLAGCKDTDPASCYSGDQQVCHCSDQSSGVQTCGIDRTWGSCICAGSDAGVDASTNPDAAPPTDAGVDAGGEDAGVTNPCESSGTTHLLISEVVTQPGEGEFIEIWNTGATPVDLSDFYLSDNAAYHLISTGAPWAPTTSVPGADFLARFPPGTTLGAGDVLVVSAGTDLYGYFAACPDFAIGDDPSFCNGSAVPKMLAPTNGSLGTEEGSMLSNSREMVMLFCWDGSASTVVDVDYVTWGDNYDASSRVDKTGVTGYLADTPIANQSYAPPIVLGNGDESIGRCGSAETGETTTGGNGSTGHDETSEQLGTTFTTQSTATPGAVNPCN